MGRRRSAIGATLIPARVNLRERLNALRRHPAVAAWPFVVVIFTQMAVGGFSVYTLTAIRGFVSGESLWSKGQHEAVYYLSLYLDSHDPADFRKFRTALAVPLAYRRGRDALESVPPEPAVSQRAFVEGGSSPEDVPSALWMFRNFRGFPPLERAIDRWKEADPYILELAQLGRAIGTDLPESRVGDLRNRVEAIDAALTPRTTAFSRALDDGARVVERLLMTVNIVLAAALAALTIWRVGKVLTQRRSFEEALAFQASHDELTGLLNRRAFEQRLRGALAAPGGGEGTPCALMFLDLDQFKVINDTCGHAAGDAMLRRLCPPMREILGDDHCLARLGGDEFGILLHDVDLAAARHLAERLRLAVEGVGFLWSERSFTVTASIGLVHNRAGALMPDEMMSHADVACFMAKERGRNRVHVHRDADQALRGRIREMTWVQRIHSALADDRFCLQAQEIVALDPDRADGIHLELLLRMRDEDGSLVPPSSFLPAAERFGLTTLIDRWVVRRAFTVLAERRAVADAAPIASCGINLSGATVGDDAFLGFLKESFARTRVPPHTICFEVTETAAIVNIDAARSFIRDLRGLGCTFALDDFGAGMSSFSYLKALPVDYLKIDGGFVKNLLTERPDRAMVEMINHVGHVMGKRIVAEFVETRAIMEALRDIGIDYAQGYAIARPQPFTPSFAGIGALDRQHREEERHSA